MRLQWPNLKWALRCLTWGAGLFQVRQIWPCQSTAKVAVQAAVRAAVHAADMLAHAGALCQVVATPHNLRRFGSVLASWPGTRSGHGLQ